MISGLRFLENFYRNIYYLCKNRYLKDLLPFFENTRVTLVPFDENKNEDDEIRRILTSKYANNDVLVCGFCHKNKFTKKCTNEQFKNLKLMSNKYTVEYDTITNEAYHFIEEMYSDLGLNLAYFFEYYDVPSTEESLKHYNSAKDYHIVFVQSQNSGGQRLNISNLLQKYLRDDKVIIICSNENLYNVENKTEEMQKKYNICQNILTNSRVINYKDIILNSNEIYIIDSAFTGMVLPFLKTNRLKAEKVRIVLRNLVDTIVI